MLDLLKMPLPSKKKIEIEMEPAEDEASEMGAEEEEMEEKEMAMPNEMLKDVSDDELLMEAKARGLI